MKGKAKKILQTSDAVTSEFFNHLHPDFCMSQISKAVIDLSNPTKNTRT